MNSESVAAGSYALPSCKFTAPADKRFKGWAYAPDGEVIAGTEINIKENTILYAIWDKASAVTYDLTTKVTGVNGKISAGKTGLAAGSTETVIFTPDTGYEIDKVTVNGVETAVLSNVLNVTMDGNKTVVVTYKEIKNNDDGEEEIISGGGTSSKPSSGTTATPDTGASGMTNVWIALLIVSVIGFVTALIYGKRKRQEK